MRVDRRRRVDNPVDGARRPSMLVLYDADCGFCTTSSRAMTNRWFRADAEARSFQSVNLDDFGLTVDKCAEKLHVVDGTRVFVGGAAISAGSGGAGLTGVVTTTGGGVTVGSTTVA